ncbi:MAG TPA: TMEM175 family protein [Candidatus Acidoferrum sp.]|nr:TMEM175 family protein [Candidatus Acidoferrum sp.]
MATNIQPTPIEGRRELVVRRLEGFSDIVIGFSLAQLGLSLVIPPHAIDFVVRPLGLVAFFITFAVVVRFWWTHFRLFRSYFEPNRVMMTLNFVALAGLVAQVFALQLYLHFVPLGEGMVAARIYFAFFVASYGVLAAMFGFGMIYRWRALSLGERKSGIRDFFGILGTVAGCAVGNVMTSGKTFDTTNVYVDVQGKHQIVAVAPTQIFLGIFIGWIAGVVAGRLVARLVVPKGEETVQPRSKAPA